jgi:hypothetical protein
MKKTFGKLSCRFDDFLEGIWVDKFALSLFMSY